METQNKSPALAGDPGFQMQLTLAKRKSTTAPARPLKWRRVLEAFLKGRSYNRFEAERELHDHALHSSASGFQDRGLVIERREETVPGFQGAPTRVMRYWLAPESRAKAMELLGLDAEESRHGG